MVLVNLVVKVFLLVKEEGVESENNPLLVVGTIFNIVTRIV